MEGKNIQTVLPTEPVEGQAFAIAEIAKETKVCKCCGKEKSLTEFNRQAKGYRKICKLCQHAESGASDRFKDVSSRDLWEELKRRGYEGPIKIKRIETWD